MSDIKKSGFRRLLELGDKEHKKLLSDFYIVSESRIDNFLDCLESGKKEIERLKKENKRMREAIESALDLFRKWGDSHALEILDDVLKEEE